MLSGGETRPSRKPIFRAVRVGKPAKNIARVLSHGIVFTLRKSFEFNIVL